MYFTINYKYFRYIRMVQIFFVHDTIYTYHMICTHTVQYQQLCQKEGGGGAKECKENKWEAII